MLRTQEQITTLNTLLAALDAVFMAEFSDLARGLFRPVLMGIKDSLRAGDTPAAIAAVQAVTTPPPGVTQERLEVVKQMILALFP